MRAMNNFMVFPLENSTKEDTRIVIYYYISINSNLKFYICRVPKKDMINVDKILKI